MRNMGNAQAALSGLVEKFVGDMLALTHHKDAPWHLIPADNKRHARLEILKVSCKQIAAALGE